MRILLANHHLDERAGSELYTLELAIELRQAGHQAAVFTFVAGRLAEQFLARGIPLFHPGTPAADVEAFAPEMLHVHHAPCLYYLGALRLDCPVVFSSLGPLPALEAPPLVWPGVSRWLVISEEVQQTYAQSAFAREVPVTVFRNWFDDRDLVRPAPAKGTRGAGRWAVVTNHLSPTLQGQLETLAARNPAFSWEHFGAPRNSREITPALVTPFDGVITIGRTVLLATALGKPCLVYDQYGCDGLVTPDRLGVLASRNFSGRLVGHQPPYAEVASLLLEEAPAVDTAAVQEAVWEGFRLSKRRDEALAIYELARASGTRLDDVARATYSRAGMAHAESLGVMSRWHSYELAGLRRELDETRAQLADEKKRLEAEILRLSEDNARLRHEAAQVESSLAWRTVTRLRSLKDLGMPRDSRLRRLYDRTLARVKNSGDPGEA